MDNFEDEIDNEEILSTLDENSNKDYFWEIDPLPPPHLPTVGSDMTIR